MATATKKETRKPRKEGLFFSVTGEGMTEMIRDSWVSDTPKHALRICYESLGMTTEQALEVITGKKKLTGDTRYDEGLDWADDNTTEVCGIKLDVQTMVSRLENKYIDASEAINLLNNGGDRIVDKLRFVDTDFDNDEMNDNQSSLRYYKKRVADAIEQLEAVYPLVGKSMKDLPINKVRSSAQIIKEARKQQIKDDFEYNKGKNNLDEKFDNVMRFSQEAILNNLEKDEEEQEEKKDINSRFYTSIGGGASFYISHCDVKKCKDEGLHAGWLLPDGTFYGGDGIWIHRGILDELSEFDFFKDKNYSSDEDDVQDRGNWIKYSGNDWIIWEFKHKLTKEQIEFIIEYTTVVRQSTFFTVNSFYNIHISVFAKLLDGVTQFNSSEMREESEPIIAAEREAEKNKKDNPLANFPTVDEVSEIDPLSTPFFQPDADFVKWLIKYANGRMIVDCGAGSGYLTAMIHHLGYNKCIAIEPHYTEERNIFWRSKGYQFHVFFKPSEEEKIIRDIPNNNVLLVFARPCHSGFVSRTINKNMPVGAEALYISHKNNTQYDLGDIAYTEIKHEGTSKNNEFVLSIKK